MSEPDLARRPAVLARRLFVHVPQQRGDDLHDRERAPVEDDGRTVTDPSLR